MDTLQPFTAEKLREAREKLLAENAAQKEKFIDDSVRTLYNNIVAELVKDNRKPFRTGTLYSNVYNDEETLYTIQHRSRDLFPCCEITRENQFFTVKWEKSREKTLEQFLDELGAAGAEAVKANAIVHRSNDAAIQELISKSKDNLPFSLFETPLETDPKTGRAFNSSTLRDCDVIIGFVADTDASFTLVVTIDRDNTTRFPVTLKAGEFQLAWRNEAPFPLIRLVYHDLWIEDLKGSVRRVSACLDTDIRRRMAQTRAVALGSEWFTSSGMLGTRNDNGDWAQSVAQHLAAM